MIHLLLTFFAFSLLYIGIASRLKTYISMLIVQGLILFAVTFIQLEHVNWLNLLVISLETIIFKAIAIPYFLAYVLAKNKIKRESEPFISNFGSLFIISLFFVLSFVLVQVLQFDSNQKILFINAFTAIFTGLYIIVSRKKVLTHTMGYLIMENGVFLLSMAVGNHFPFLVTIGILLDLFMSVLVLGIFVNKIGNTFEEMSIENLANLKN